MSTHQRRSSAFWEELRRKFISSPRRTRATAAAKSVVRDGRDKLLRPLLEGQDRTLLAIGRHESRAIRTGANRPLSDVEFRVWSQFGEDGIIQYLVGRVPIAERSFVEFGVEDYRQSNTRFLLENDDWRGLILDGGAMHIDFVRKSGLGWRHDISACREFVTAENINVILKREGFVGDIGLLSVDIDGMDYWVVSALTAAHPRILIVEYNSIFGPERALTVPYSASFSRMQAHWSGLYAGCSLQALVRLTHGRGYSFVGSNSAGNNAFFVRDDVRGDLPSLTAEEGWVQSRFRESRSPDGRLSFVASHTDRLRLIRECRLLDLDTGAIDSLGRLFGLNG